MADVNKNAKSVDIDKQDVNSMADNNQDTAGSECQHNNTAFRSEGYWDCYDCDKHLYSWSLVKNKEFDRLLKRHDTEKKKQAVQAFGEKVLEVLPKRWNKGGIDPLTYVEAYNTHNLQVEQAITAIQEELGDTNVQPSS